MKRREFKRAVKHAILLRATKNGRLHCEKCGMDITGKPAELDHVIPEQLIVDKSKPLTAKDGQLLGLCCHRGEDGKTNQDVARIAKSKRQMDGHVRLGKPKRNLIPGSRGTRFKRKISGETVLR